ncbi:hypothetical protein [Miltoncostaea oceani]|uniref:hypothetical protein n=1 Tax=Miltoncostaea oceani TaxID=2843216 RepID=UPI001C3DE192|nr:hypothetical protein [Miltoncostaea oceani]
MTVGPTTCEAVGDELVAISAPVTNAGEVPARMRLGSSVGVISDGEPTNRFGSDVAVRVEPGETAIIHTSISLAQGQQFATPLSCSLDPLADPVVSAVSIDSEDLALELASSVDEVSCSGDDGQCVDEVTCTDPSGGTADCQVALRGPGAGAGGGASRLDYEVVVGEDGAWEKTLVASS